MPDTIKTILVVDDELTVADMIQAALEEEGFQAVVAHNGRAALAQAKVTAPDLILLDFMMPIMDGPATLAAIRADTLLADVPVIIMSSVDEKMVASLVTGHQNFIRKPFTLHALYSLIRRQLASDTPSG